MKKVYFTLLLAAYMIQGVFPFKLQFGYGLNLQNVAVYLVLIALLISEFSTGKAFRKNIPGIWLIIIGTGYILLNIIFSQVASTFHYPFFEHIILFKRVYFDAIIVYVMAFLLADNKDDAKLFLAIIIISFAVLNAYNLIIQFVRPTQLSLQYERFSGFGNSNKTAYLMCFMLPFVYYFFSIQKRVLHKIFFLSLIGLTVLSVALSGSRGGIIVLGIVVISMMVLFRDVKMSIVMAAMIPIAIVFLWDNPFFQETISRLSQLSERSLEDASSNRFDIWRNIFRTMISNPLYFLMGTGFNTATIVGQGSNAHNMYLKVALELGVFGLLLFVATILRLLYCAAGITITDTKYKKALLTSFFIVFTAWLFSSLQGIWNFITLISGMSLSYFLYSEKESETG